MLPQHSQRLGRRQCLYYGRRSFSLLLIPRDQARSLPLRQGCIDRITTTQAALGSQPTREAT